MTDFALIAERIAEYPIGSAPDPHTRDDAINALREAAQLSAQRDALVAALEEWLPIAQRQLDSLNAQYPDILRTEAFTTAEARVERLRAALARAKGD